MRSVMTENSSADVINKVVNVMLMYTDEDHEMTGMTSFHGPIIRVDDQLGIVIRADGGAEISPAAEITREIARGEEIAIPPELSALISMRSAGGKGLYIGEPGSPLYVKDPDYSSNWMVDAYGTWVV